MKETGMIFSGQSVRGMLAGRKIMTRRVIKPQPYETEMCPVMVCIDVQSPSGYTFSSDRFDDRHIKSKYRVGDLIWVRETFLQEGSSMLLPGGTYENIWHSKIEYIADGAKPRTLDPESYYPHSMIKRPSIFMPKWAARLWLEITNIRVERVQDISEEDAKAEGATKKHLDDLGQTWKTYKRGFESLWDSLFAKRSFGWEKNPFVWVLTFKKV